ncbi:MULTISPECIES: regulatory signaling modulator protein AmpE [Dyella]|uniref:Beta-lactamase induction protein n=2 Tax=Dyella TaxID=231454 RepID=A0A4R0YPS1_9GAMM|nr:MULTISPECIES: regulatory signaling modulator protein AmpE [Dyella]TBR36522.1 beta-lactamase induction protein [Dyella terrae]TCI08386.1 beta-lactamase induction protein [Dyella soli]
MAVSLLAALIAIGLLHLQPHLAHWRGDGGFRRWVTQIGDTSGTGRVLLALLVPVALCLLALWLIGLLPMADLFRLAFALVVLLYAFGPHAYEADLEAILRAPDGASQQAAVQSLTDDGEPIAWNAIAVGEAVAYAALRRRFGVLLWFFILGPAGALLYRLAQTLARGPFDLDPEAKSTSRAIAHFMDWLPAQLLVFTLALVGHWDAVVHAWKEWHRQAIPGSWLRDGPGFLGAAARADIQVDIEAGDGYAEERSDVLAELKRLRSAFVRALLAWLSVVALIVIAGWMS